MSRVFIAIGSNEGERLEQISKALHMLRMIDGIRVVQLASIIETDPVGGPPQVAYLNTAIELETSFPPKELLARLKLIEKRLDRKESAERWGPRPIDLDILLYDDCIIDEPDLKIPHPRMHERYFVLFPLAQLAPEMIHPTLGETITALLDKCFVVV